MGIGKSAFKLLIREAQKGVFKDKKILQLGKQDIFITARESLEIINKTNLNSDISLLRNLKTNEYIDDTTFFSLLGFKKIESIDTSSYEKASLIYDLNIDLPVELHGQYDVIFDGGTLEHVFNVPKVLENIHKLLNTDGIIIHSSPSNNHVDHGFYMFSPTLFNDYYSSNSYNILTSYYIQYTPNHNRTWEIFEYTPGSLNIISYGGAGNKMSGIWFVAKKQSSSTYTNIPQQNNYILEWNKSTFTHKTKFSSLKTWLKKSKLLLFLIIKIKTFIHFKFVLKRIRNF